MANYGHIIIFSFIGGILSLTGGLVLMSKTSWAQAMAKYATPFAAGALLAAVFLDLLKEGVEQAPVQTVMVSTLIGMIIFFFAERFLYWFHHHHDHKSKEHSDPTVGLIIVGDILHNALDGVAIAASFLISVPTGIITTIAVATHEIPQEIGDFGLMLKKGMSRKKVLVVNVLSAMATMVMAVVTFWLGSDAKLPIGVLLGLSAGFLLYIAASDIIPTIHDEVPNHKIFDIRPFLLLLGAIVVGVSINLAHSFIENDHSHGNVPAQAGVQQSIDSQKDTQVQEEEHTHDEDH